jgi:hypothetical protein
MTHDRIRWMLAPATVAAVMLAGTAVASAGLARREAPKLCTMMESGKHFPRQILTKKASSAAGGNVQCEWTDAKAKHVVALIVFDNHSVANASSLFSGSYARAPGTRIRIKGADEAIQRTQKKPREGTSTTILWRKGRYTGSFGISGPGDWGSLQNAKGDLEPFLTRLPR